MKTPQQIKNEVEKGCGYYDETWEQVNGNIIKCGYKVKGKVILCPCCLAKLSILTEYDKAMKEMIEKLKEVDMSEFLTPNGVFLDGLFHEKIDEILNLSKIGDNSDNSQTERGSRSSDKGVAQPYSKSDKTTKEVT